MLDSQHIKFVTHVAQMLTLFIWVFILFGIKGLSYNKYSKPKSSDNQKKIRFPYVKKVTNLGQCGRSTDHQSDFSIANLPNFVKTFIENCSLVDIFVEKFDKFCVDSRNSHENVDPELEIKSFLILC